MVHSDGQELVCPKFWARVELEGRTFELNVIGNGIRVQGALWGLVGRDILNQAVVINGPRSFYTIA